MKEFNAITTVYSYYLPEVRSVVDDVVRVFPHDVFLRSTTKDGLDNFHVPVIDKLVRYHSEDVPGLAEFGNRYPTAGSEEGIREYISQIAREGISSIYMFQGDYEGYREVASTRGISIREMPWGTDPSQIVPGHWFISNPSARDGNIVPTEVVKAICDAGHKVFYDLSYLETTNPVIFDVSHPNIVAVAISFSKPYGLFYYRIGFLFTRDPVLALYGNKWFKNVFSLLIADRLLDSLKLHEISRRYKSLQASIVDTINTEHGLSLHASDAFLLAYMREEDVVGLSEEKIKMLERFKRADGWRFCLTRYFLEAESADK